MKEDFLHYLWKFAKFDALNLKTTSGEELIIINTGQYLQQAGPDFFNAQLIIGNQKWAGNVELHLKSSDWYIHHHEIDPAYENVILHVVWEHDTEIFRNNNAEIPVLELKHYVKSDTLEKYQSLKTQKTWLFCEKQLPDVDAFLMSNWLERLFFERLERKSKPIFELLNWAKSDWEAVLFCLLAKNFGLNSNGEQFLKMAQSIPFQLIRKESFEVENLEALFFGYTGLLDIEKEDQYYKDLKFRFYYLMHKYQLEKPVLAPIQFFKHRPDNFPTIRLSQFAALYHSQQNLFSKMVGLNSISAIYEVFQVSASSYWLNHYQFDKESPKKSKTLSKSFVDLLVINTLLPIQFAYSQSLGKDNTEDLMALLHDLAPEKNAILDKFVSFGLVAKNAFETQALLQLKNEYCNNSKCLGCAIGIELMRTN